MKLFSNRLKKSLIKIKYHKYIYIGVSGGSDSIALLNLVCNNLCYQNYIKVIHINHSYNYNSYKWFIFCKNICDNNNIIFYHYTIKNKLFNSNLENNFRVIRFKYFINIIKKNSTLFLAQHLNDLLETIFIKMLRGSGLRGLLGIQFKNKLYKLNIIRPFLKFFKSDIITYIYEKKKFFITDFSNFNILFTRNYFRNYLFSQINFKQYKVQNIIKSIFLLNRSFKFLCTNLYFFLKKNITSHRSLYILFLKKVSFYFFAEFIIQWVIFNGFKSLCYKHILEFYKIFISNNKIVYIKINNYFIEKFGNNIYIYNMFLTNKYFLFFFTYNYIKKNKNIFYFFNPKF